MTKKAEFNAEEWSAVVEAPLLAAMRVVAADRGGTIRESVAVGKTYAQARQQHGGSELLDEVVASPPAMDAQRLRSGGDLDTVAMQRVREAARLVAEKASPEEVEAYKRFVLSVAGAAAQAHKEGGFLGVGGAEVSEAERTALDQIASTLEIGSAAD